MFKTVLWISISIWCGYASAQSEIEIPSSYHRQQLLLTLGSEMQRLDGEALYVRRNRATSWNETLQKLAAEAEGAKDWLQAVLEQALK